MPPEKLVLAFDTSAAHCAVALLLGNAVLVQRLEEMHKGQAERLIPLLEDVLTKAGKDWTDLDAIGVGIGPGNFTGIRLSVSAARGLALSLEIPAIGVSSFEAMAEGIKRPVLASVDARRGQVYLSLLNETSLKKPLLTDIQSIPAEFRKDQATCVGQHHTAIADEIGATWAEPLHPLAVSIARIASARACNTNPRPAPLYLKAADAAPSRDAPPVILA